jgi:hypothetical protein
MFFDSKSSLRSQLGVYFVLVSYLSSSAWAGRAAAQRHFNAAQEAAQRAADHHQSLPLDHLAQQKAARQARQSAAHAAKAQSIHEQYVRVGARKAQTQRDLDQARIKASAAKGQGGVNSEAYKKAQQAVMDGRAQLEAHQSKLQGLENRLHQQSRQATMNANRVQRTAAAHAAGHAGSQGGAGEAGESHKGVGGGSESQPGTHAGGAAELEEASELSKQKPSPRKWSTAAKVGAGLLAAGALAGALAGAVIGGQQIQAQKDAANARPGTPASPGPTVNHGAIVNSQPCYKNGSLTSTNNITYADGYATGCPY